MSFLTDINCSTVLEAIRNEKLKQKDKFNSDSNDFVNINPNENTFWTGLFANCFLCFESDSSIKNTLTHDDMLFFVSKFDNDQVNFSFLFLANLIF